MSGYFTRFIAESQRPLESVESQQDTHFKSVAVGDQSSQSKTSVPGIDDALDSVSPAQRIETKPSHRDGHFEPTPGRLESSPNRSETSVQQDSQSLTTVNSDSEDTKIELNKKKEAGEVRKHRPSEPHTPKPSLKITRKIRNDAPTHHTAKSGTRSQQVSCESDVTKPEKATQTGIESEGIQSSAEEKSNLSEENAENRSHHPNQKPEKALRLRDTKPSFRNDLRQSSPTQNGIKQEPQKPNVYIGEVRISVVDTTEKTKPTNDKPKVTEDSDSRLLIRGL
ncbi:hypothetical protein [Vibrio sp. EA2]|uniref:hypothetical protein n=1 Tax=Vibrio sp. EA2 TaxID=3079860 RepID=UPI002948D3FB|nr:hypothetical protein [Vibrio sp. EA2]MDV6250474.1 hypothetical protein [Vibrio sp. EA2]